MKTPIHWLLSATYVWASIFLVIPSAFAEETVKAPSALETIREGGPLLLLIWAGIVLASLSTLTFIVQNFIALRKDRLAPPELFAALKKAIARGEYQKAWDLCDANDSYLANVVQAGLGRLGRGKEAVEDALAETGLEEATDLRTCNSYLSVIGVVSPMIGLLGTVIGMMGAFTVLAGTGISDPRALSGKIGEVLLATASGLFIAIPAFIFYYIFRNRAQKVIVYADNKVNALVRDLPYEKLVGVHVGDEDDTELDPTFVAACLSCGSDVTFPQPACSQCGAEVKWPKDLLEKAITEA